MSQKSNASSAYTYLRGRDLYAVYSDQDTPTIYRVATPSSWIGLPTETIAAFAPNHNDATMIASALNQRADNQPAKASDPEYRQVGGARHQYSFIEYYVKKLAGRILTVLDASYVNDQQNKAVKRLVKDAIRSALSEIWSKSFTDNYCCGEASKEEPDPLKD